MTAIDQTPDGRLWQSVRQQSQTRPLPDQAGLQSKVFCLGVKMSALESGLRVKSDATLSLSEMIICIVGNNVFYFQFQILKAKDDVLFQLSPVLLAWVSSSQILSRTCLGRMLQFWALLQALLLVKQRLEMLNRITSLTNCLSSIDKNTSDMTLKNKGNIYLHLYNSWTTLCQKVN